MATPALSMVPGRLLSVIQGEFREMPGMRLTRAQFQRLWRLDDTECERAIEVLKAIRFLAEDRRGRLHCLFEATA